MSKKKYSKIKNDLYDYTDDMQLLSNLSKVLLSVLENNEELNEREKISLSIILDRLIDSQKETIVKIRTKLYGVN